MKRKKIPTYIYHIQNKTICSLGNDSIFQLGMFELLLVAITLWSTLIRSGSPVKVLSIDQIDDMFGNS